MLVPPAPPRAPFAADARASRGRLHPEPPSPTRTPFQRDRDRIVHSTAFRRLAHKTQVFVHHEGDHFRTRLTHTIEVAQLARALARAFGLDDDLAEAVALGHDLGHTPFGHAGEDALDECLRERGGFDHNSHGLRLVTALESHYADFDGLNLCQETLEGLVKHNGPLLEGGVPRERWRKRGVPAAILAYDARQSLHLADFPTLEAQCAALADDIAYNAHDIDDGLRAGLFDFEAMRAAPCLAALIDEIDALRPGLETTRKIHETSRRLITRFVEDAIRHTAAALAEARIASAADVAEAGRTLVSFSEPTRAAEREIKSFLFAHMYRHPDVDRRRLSAIAMVRALFRAYRAAPEAMPPVWARRAREGEPDLAVADYIAGMTDRFALGEYRRLFDPSASLR